MITAYYANRMNNEDTYPTSFDEPGVENFVNLLFNEIEEAANKKYHHVISNVKNYTIEDLYVIADVLITQGYHVHIDAFADYARILVTWDENNELIYSISKC